MLEKEFAEKNCSRLHFDHDMESSEEQSRNEPRHGKGGSRPCAWGRKDKYKRRKERKYHLQHHPVESPGKKGDRLHSAIYFAGSDTD